MPTSSIMATKIDHILTQHPAPAKAPAPAAEKAVVDAKAEVLNAAANAVEKAGDKASAIAKENRNRRYLT